MLPSQFLPCLLDTTWTIFALFTSLIHPSSLLILVLIQIFRYLPLHPEFFHLQTACPLFWIFPHFFNFSPPCHFLPLLSDILQAQNCSQEGNYGRQKSSHYRQIIQRSHTILKQNHLRPTTACSKMHSKLPKDTQKDPFVQTSQELRMLSSVTLNCQVTKIVMDSDSQLSEL